MIEFLTRTVALPMGTVILLFTVMITETIKLSIYTRYDCFVQRKG